MPQENRYLYVTGEMYSLIRQSTEFLGIESLGAEALAKGIVGDVFGAKIVKVPASYLPEGVFFLLAHRMRLFCRTRFATQRYIRTPRVFPAHC